MSDTSAISETSAAFQLRDMRIDPATGQITGRGRSLRLEPKPMAVLQTLRLPPTHALSWAALLITFALAIAVISWRATELYRAVRLQVSASADRAPDPTARGNLMNVSIELGRYGEAHKLPASGWLGIALSQQGRFGEALAPLLDAVAAERNAQIRIGPGLLIDRGFLLRACAAMHDPHCADEQTQARALLTQIHAAGWRSTSFMTAAGLLLAAQGQAAQALPYLQVAARQGHLYAGHFRDDARMQPILNNVAVRQWLNTLPAASTTRPARHASNS